MRRKFGFWSIVLLGLNAILGSGIFLLPSSMMAIAGPFSLWVILFDSLLVVTIALCFAEAAGYFKRNGGAYLYARAAFGDFVGFEVGFIKWAVGIIAWASMAAGFVAVLDGIWPGISGGLLGKGILVGLIAGLTILNLCGVKVSKIANNIMTIGKLLPILVFMGIGLFFMQPDNLSPIMSLEAYEPNAFAVAAILFLYTFSGFESIAVAAGDMENPKRDLPIAILLVMALVSIVYFGVQAISIGILGGALSSSAAPLADATQVFWGKAGYAFIMLGMLISVGGVNLAASFITPRIGEALAHDGMVPRFIAKENENGVPVWSILITGVCTVLIALSGSFTQLVMISAVSRFAQYIPTCLAVIVLRRKFADKPSTFHIPGGSLIPGVALAVSFWLLMHASWQELAWGLGGLLIGIPLYFIMRASESR
tara:strand:+ start:362 stop:1636 length:1275 start_codon:yes stop_codon:yes gene_type:complete